LVELLPSGNLYTFIRPNHAVTAGKNATIGPLQESNLHAFSCRAVARPIIGEEGVAYIRVLPDGFVLKAIVFTVCEHEYINIPPPPQIIASSYGPAIIIPAQRFTFYLQDPSITTKVQFKYCIRGRYNLKKN
jgi:hypothetical protein